MLSLEAMASAILPTLDYIYPATVFILFSVLSLFESFTLQQVKRPERFNPKPSHRNVGSALLIAFLATYLLQLTATLLKGIFLHDWDVADHVVIGRLSCMLVFGVLLSRWAGSEAPSTNQLHASLVVAFIFESVLLIQSLLTGPTSVSSPYDILDISMRGLRLVLLSGFTVALISRHLTQRTTASSEETESLLPKLDDPNGTADGQATTYGATQQTGQGTATEEDIHESRWERRRRLQQEAMEKRLNETENWFQFAKEFSILLPYVWPFGQRALQLRAFGVVLCILSTNALHLLIPRQTAIIMDSLTGTVSSNPWVAVGVYAILRLASSECGVQLLQQWLWLPIKYYTHETLARAAFSHVMHLSADFHDSKGSSDIMMAMQGGSAISGVIESIFLQALPMVVDMVVAIVYLSATFGPYEGLITVATGIIFLHCATRLVEKSQAMSRQRRNAHYREYNVRFAGFTGWQTVTAFNQIGYEDNRHADAVTNRWTKEKQYAISWRMSMAFQTLVLTAGLLASAFFAVHQIQSGRVTSGQFTMLLAYWAQLTSPLRFFATLGKELSDDFISAERLLEVMKATSSVVNKPSARPFKYDGGQVQFSDVTFSYDGNKPVINNMSLLVKGGEKIAFVGATGAGKSTLLKLLFRYYDTGSGSINIDGQDIRDVDLYTLRDRIGMVPQSPTLFDDTIMNNVRYAKMTASDEEVFEACRAACIHDKILGFTNGYETRVGERGVKLSGGELQRVAIARAMLKKPDIVILDEATSAVDTDTEQQIQQSFARLCEGRTTFIVAHRLSTIKNADRIVVVERGAILEQGTHKDLLAAGNRYADLWSKQGFDIADAPPETSQLLDFDVSEPASGTSGSITPKNPKAAADAETVQGKNSKLNPVAAEFTPRLATSNTAIEADKAKNQAKAAPTGQ